MNLFDQLAHETVFTIENEKRSVATIARDNFIVRTTSPLLPSQAFTELHETIASTLPFPVNNASIEIYTHKYNGMKFHTDCALDLAANSHIALVSFYENESEQNVRRLVIQDKESGELKTVQLTHGSVVVFSTEDNATHLHRILSDEANRIKSRWLGITFRLSKTRGEFRKGTRDECHEFFRLKGSENRSTHFEWPVLDFTV